jgi:hypothetical protein
MDYQRFTIGAEDELVCGLNWAPDSCDEEDDHQDTPESEVRCVVDSFAGETQGSQKLKAWRTQGRRKGEVCMQHERAMPDAVKGKHAQ